MTEIEKKALAPSLIMGLSLPFHLAFGIIWDSRNDPAPFPANKLRLGHIRMGTR